MPDILNKRILMMFAILLNVCLAGNLHAFEDGNKNFERLNKQYDASIKPLVKEYCLECHSTEANEGELDLEQFSSLKNIRKNTAIWVKVREMLELGEMPPEDSPQFSKIQKINLQKWINQYLDAEAKVNAGDPGQVVLRRLNNSEYNYTIQDITGIDINPTKQFPIDGAAGEGFTNTGSALVMSPSLVTKYLDAGKNIASYAVLLPEGFRFSAGKTRRDWTNEILDEIRSIYLKYTGELGDASSLNKWSVSKPSEITDRDGRVNLKQYFDLLIRHRNKLQSQPDQILEIARQKKLSPVYIEHLRKMLLSENNSLLLKEIQSLWKNNKTNHSALITEKVYKWQSEMWKYLEVGHFGLLKGWQKSVPVVRQLTDFRKKLTKQAGNEDITFYLNTGAAGDGHNSDFGVWSNLSLERPGKQSIYLKDVKAVTHALKYSQKQLSKNILKYLEVAYDLKNKRQKVNLQKISQKHQLDSLVLKAFLEYSGISTSDDAIINQYLTMPLNNIAGFSHVNGWGNAGLSALMVIGNSSDKSEKVPGDLGPHKIAVHPRPERWVAAGWKSPIEGDVTVNVEVTHAHPSCGNGISWKIEQKRGNHNKILKSGIVNKGGQLDKAISIEKLSIHKNDLISLVIGPRDGNHACDLTEIDLSVTQLDGKKQTWSLTQDCADRIDEGNPLSDKKGNAAIWHFHTGLIKGNDKNSSIPEKSLLVQFLNDKNKISANKTALKILSLLMNGPTTKTSKPDKLLHQQLTSIQGPVFSQINVKQLVKSVEIQNVNSKYGLDPQLFGKDSQGKPVKEYDLHVKAPSIIKVVLPAELFNEAGLISSAHLSSTANGESSVQFQITDTPPLNTKQLFPGVPVIVHSNSPADIRFKIAMEEFRQLFPAAMCYTRIVPVDVVVSLVLFFREDDHLKNLMLNKKDQQRLDQLWKELYYVSQDALTSVTVFEQLLEFASQDGDPTLYEPLREIIYGRSKSYKNQLIASEASHVFRLMEFAKKAYRRPLSDAESSKLKGLYQKFRQQGMPHENSFRLTLAKILTSPSFLYKIEKVNPGPHSTPVSDWETANRLSYFLWSSSPDQKLIELAKNGQLKDPNILVKQSKRMVKSNKTRRLAIEFACQWFHIRNFDQHNEKNEKLYPEFAELRTDMYEESIQYFLDLFQNDRSVLNIIDSDYTYLNENLASLYQIPGVKGNHWRIVKDVKQYGRGGILGQASTLSKQSGASRTSPILRGNWVSETILGEKLPKPPADVPLLPNTVPKGLTERQLIEQHSSNPSCAKCHKRMDPYGFALENYDTIGQYRSKAKDNQAIDTKTILLDGTKINGYNGLRGYLLNTRREAFLKQFCKKLLGYALGRGVKLSDEPLLKQMRINLTKNQYRFSVAVKTIITSQQFRKIRGKDYTGIK